MEEAALFNQRNHHHHRKWTDDYKVRTRSEQETAQHQQAIH
jgi:hypothetical protein